MTILEVRSSVDSGVCTWLQVHETLIRAGTSAHLRRQFLEGEFVLGSRADRMLRELVESGAVPAP